MAEECHSSVQIILRRRPLGGAESGGRGSWAGLVAPILLTSRPPSERDSVTLLSRPACLAPSAHFLTSISGWEPARSATHCRYFADTTKNSSLINSSVPVKCWADGVFRLRCGSRSSTFQ
jgi:hypothetical protein